MALGFQEYSTTLTNEDFVKAMEAQGVELVSFTSFGPFEIIGPPVTQKSEPYFGTRLREACVSLRKLWDK